MDQGTADFVKERLKPALAEVFDGFVIMGYTTNAEGQRTRLVIYSEFVDGRGQCPDASIADGLKAPLVVARAWGSGQL